MPERAQKILIHGGRVLDPASGVDGPAEVAIAEGRILAVGERPDGFAPDLEIDATGQLVCPGLVDLAARLREPGQEHKADIASETRAAVAGGITTLCCPPDTDPVIDTPAVVELIRQRAEAAGQARVVTLGALTQGLAGEQLAEMAALREAGCCGLTNLFRPLANSLVLRRAYEYAATFGITVFIHAEDHWLARDGCAHEGAVATRLGLPGIPAAAETAAVAYHLALIEETGVRAHFCRLTTERAVRMIARARYDGAPVTADAAVPYLYLSEVDLGGFDTQCHVHPPLRTLRDRDGLRAGLGRGTLDALCSDHQPHEADAKLDPFPSTEPGISGLDTLLSLTLRLVDEGVLDLADAIGRLTIGPARILGLEERGIGSLTPGKTADVIVLDIDAPWEVGPASLLSRGHNTPFMGWQLGGRVSCTLVGGEVVFMRGEE
ncbi:MAG TPA: dihydroorotase [Thiotrichales bacterium]|nr:dihydroorotase [Thiotrichales bacterium]